MYNINYSSNLQQHQQQQQHILRRQILEQQQQQQQQTKKSTIQEATLSPLISSMSNSKLSSPKLWNALKKTRLWWKDIIDRRTMKRLYQLDNWSNNNDVTIYFDGDHVFKSIWDSIDNAKESINIETYTIEPDSIGLKTLELLTKASQRGCKVKFVYDAIGSSSISDSHLEALRESGATIYKFNPLFSLSNLWKGGGGFSPFPVNFRNHRKMIVIDNTIGYVGGMNISEKYAGRTLGNSYFRDTHLKIIGPAVLDLANSFYSRKRDTEMKSHQPPDHHIQLYNINLQKELDDSNDASKAFPYHLYYSNEEEKQKEIDKYLFNRYLEYFSDFNHSSDQIEHEDEKDDDDNGEDGDEDDELDNSSKSMLDEEEEELLSDIDEDEDQENNIYNDQSSYQQLNDNQKLVSLIGELKIKDVSAQVLESNLLRGKRNLQRSLSIIFKDCKKYCEITTPYFLPPKLLRLSIIDIAKRGGEVTILTAGKSDVPWVRMASQYLYKSFLEQGVRIFEMYGSTLHAKTITIDGKYSTIGSYNLDHFSQKNLEIMISMTDERISRQLSRQFRRDLLRSTEITMEYLNNRSWFEKIYSFLAYQFSRIVRPSPSTIVTNLPQQNHQNHQNNQNKDNNNKDKGNIKP